MFIRNVMLLNVWMVLIVSFLSSEWVLHLYKYFHNLLIELVVLMQLGKWYGNCFSQILCCQ